VDDLNPKGKTPLTDAVRMAAKELRSEEGKATVILVSDGLETCEADPCAATAELKKAGVGLTVHVVGFGTTAEENKKLQCIADNTGGKLFSAQNAVGLKQAMAETVKLVEKPAVKQQTITVKVGVGTLEIKNAKEGQSVYDETGTTKIVDYFSESTTLKPGVYQIHNANKKNVVIRRVSVKPAEKTIIDYSKSTAIIKSEKDDKPLSLYDETGEKRLIDYISDVAHVEPGRYQLADASRKHIIVEKFDIKAGETVTPGQYAGVLKLGKTGSAQAVYDESGKKEIISYLSDHAHLPPGRYQLKNASDKQVTVESLEIKVGQETVIDFGEK
jgi:hypothetical protein